MPLRQVFPDPETTSREELKKANEAAKVFIIAVHGLNPQSTSEHAVNTWREPQNKKGRLWIRDDLKQDCGEASIFIYEYDSTVVYGNDRRTFCEKANDLLEAVRAKWTGTEGDKALLFLGHSMGGLLIEQALVNALLNPAYNYIPSATAGLAFFATPHSGGGKALLALGTPASMIAQGVGFKKGDKILDVLKSGSMFADLLREHWRHQLLQYYIVSFWGSKDGIVKSKSSRFGLPGDCEHIVALNADHSGVCRFGQSQVDEDNLELVQASMKVLYGKAIQKQRTATQLRESVEHLPVTPDSHVAVSASGSTTEKVLQRRFDGLQNRPTSQSS